VCIDDVCMCGACVGACVGLLACVLARGTGLFSCFYAYCRTTNFLHFFFFALFEFRSHFYYRNVFCFFFGFHKLCEKHGKYENNPVPGAMRVVLLIAVLSVLPSVLPCVLPYVLPCVLHVCLPYVLHVCLPYVLPSVLPSVVDRRAYWRVRVGVVMVCVLAHVLACVDAYVGVRICSASIKR
jgi:hypothetical protein